MIKNTQWSSCIVPLILVRFNEGSGQIFEKYSNTKFHENPYSRSGVVHADGRTDGQTDMKKLIVAFHNFTNAPKRA